MPMLRTPDGAVMFERGSSTFLPLSLPRPARGAEIDISKIEVLEGVPFTYILEKLSQTGPSLLASCLSARLSLPSLTLPHPIPSTLLFKFQPCSVDIEVPPTPPVNYVLAVRPSPSASNPTPSSGFILPIHDLVYRSFCAHLPPMPPRDASLPDTSLPVISIAIPSPATLPTLNTYLYTQRPDVLLGTLLAIPTFTYVESSKTRADLTNELAGSLNGSQLMSRIAFVHGVWANVCSLGVADGLLWKVLDTAWEVLLGAVAIVQSRRQM